MAGHGWTNLHWICNVLALREGAMVVWDVVTGEGGAGDVGAEGVDDGLGCS